MPIIVFNLLTEGNIARAVRGEKIGTLVSTPRRATGRSEEGSAVIDETLFDAEEKMEKAVAVAKDDLATRPHRPGHAEHVRRASSSTTTARRPR